MNEHFLSFIWKYSYFNLRSLTTTENEIVLINSPGIQNTNAGPDFDNASIVLDGLSWKGKVELHVKSSDWENHGHHYDKNYNSVILHVVWEFDKMVYRQDGSALPTLVLKDRVEQELIMKYQLLHSEKAFIPCEDSFQQVKRITKLSFLDALLMKRLERKGRDVLLKYEKSLDWREVTYSQIAKVFGIKVNQLPFEQLATKLPYKILQKHKGHLLQIEAMLFGVAGFLEEEIQDEYHEALKKEFNFLKSKYSLFPMNKEQWKFSRMRPSSYPTQRLARFAALLNQSSDLFLEAIDVTETEKVKKWVQIEVRDYWKQHYHFHKKADKVVNSKILEDNMVINGVIPLKVAYGISKQQNAYFDTSIDLLTNIGTEKNSIEKHWKKLGMPLYNACDSQASLELYNEYCSKKKCLDCMIGVELIKI